MGKIAKTKNENHTWLHTAYTLRGLCNRPIWPGLSSQHWS